MTHTEVILEALLLANPFVLLGRYDDDLAHCLEASTAATLALKARAVKARLMPCAVVAHSPNSLQLGTIGFAPSDVYKRIDWGDEPAQPYEEWLAVQWIVKPDAATREHIVIEVRDAHARYLVDLTICQLRGSGIDLPFHIKAKWEEWPEVDYHGTRIRYEKFRGTRELDVPGYQADGFRDDYLALIDLAVKSGLHVGRFCSALQKADPERYHIAIGRLNRVMGVNAGPG